MPLTALSEPQRRLGLVFENAPIGMLVRDAGNQLLQTNRALRDMLGYTADELAGIDMAALIHQEDRTICARLFTELLSGKRESSQLEARYLHKDGYDIWCKADVVLVRDDQERPHLFICILEDISERKLAEASLQRMTRHYEQILNAAGWGICGVDRHGGIVFANPEAGHMLGWKPSDLIGQEVHVIARNEDGSQACSKIESDVAGALRDGLIRHADCDAFTGRDGTRMSVEYTVAPLVEVGTVNGVVILFLDISRRVESARQMQASVDKLMQLNASLIAARHQSLQIERDLIDSGLLAVQQAVADKAGIDSAEEWLEIDIHECLDSVLNMLGSEFGTDTEIKKSYASLPLIQCLPAQINQLILCLLANVRRAFKGRRTMTIRTGQHDEEIWIEVADSGIGLSKEEDSRCFDPFSVTPMECGVVL